MDQPVPLCADDSHPGREQAGLASPRTPPGGHHPSPGFLGHAPFFLLHPVGDGHLGSRPMQSLERETLLAQAKRGDVQALGALLDSFRPYVRVIVHAVRGQRLPGRLDDSDLIQDALLQAVRSFPAFQGHTLAEFVTWLRQVAIRSAAQTLRRLGGTQKRKPAKERALAQLCDQIEAPGTAPSEQAIGKEQAAHIAEALAQLPEEHQRVILLRLIDGLSHTEIAERLGSTPAAVRMMYLRALRQLRQLCSG
jgi:RNA polymerase sigma-70 factor (ECF subfamily)